MTNPPKLLNRALLAACALLLGASGTLLVRVIAQRAELSAAATRASLAEEEARSLRQQLEAERLLAAAQNRLLRSALLGNTAPPPQSAHAASPGP